MVPASADAALNRLVLLIGDDVTATTGPHVLGDRLGRFPPSTSGGPGRSGPQQSTGDDRSRPRNTRPSSGQDGGAPMSTQLLASTTVVGELYESLMSSRRSARHRLQTMQDIERQHRHTPLTDLVDLAVTGALDRPAPDRDDVQQP